MSMTQEEQKPKATKPKPFNITKPKPKVIPEPEPIKKEIKANPVPKGLFKNDLSELEKQKKERLDKIKKDKLDGY